MLKLNVFDVECEVEIYKNTCNGNMEIQLYCFEDGFREPFLTASCVVGGLTEGELAIKNYSENEGILDVLTNENIVCKPHRFIPSGFVTLPIVRLSTLGLEHVNEVS